MFKYPRRDLLTGRMVSKFCGVREIQHCSVVAMYTFSASFVPHRHTTQNHAVFDIPSVPHQPHQYGHHTDYDNDNAGDDDMKLSAAFVLQVCK